MNKITEIRKAAGLTQEELSEKLCIKQSAVAKWENGEAMPRADKLPKLAEILGCTVDELLK